MKIIKEIESVKEFEFWGGAVDCIKKIKEFDLIDYIDETIEICFENGLTDTELNDFIWFDSDGLLYEYLTDAKENNNLDTDELKKAYDYYVGEEN